MKIKGLIEDSLEEWKGKISAVIFTGGCNLRCPYCHNPALVESYEKLPDLSEEEIFGRLKSKKPWIDGIVISGGEPTLQSDLPLFLMNIKKMDYPAKIETNGTNPKMLDYILNHKLADYISMDIKWPLEKYGKYADEVKKSIEIIRNSNIDYEFSTTVVPGLIGKEEMTRICESIKGAKNYTLQQFRSKNINLLDKTLINKVSYSKEELEGFLNIAKKYVSNAQIRGL